MSMSTNLHQPDYISITELYPESPGNTINLTLSKNGNSVTVFLTDESLKQLVQAARRYAETRSKTIVIDMVSELFNPVETSNDLPF